MEGQVCFSIFLLVTKFKEARAARHERLLAAQPCQFRPGSEMDRSTGQSRCCSRRAGSRAEYALFRNYQKGAHAAAQVVKDIESAGGKAIAIEADATDADAVTTTVDRTVATFGPLVGTRGLLRRRLPQMGQP
jgi:hypothetical protein